MKISFHKTGELNGPSYVKIPLRSSAILVIQNIDKYCYIWSILASLHTCQNNHPNRISIFNQYFIELNIDGFCYCKRIQMWRYA